MIFNELYGAYYTTVSKIIERALEHPLGKGEIRSIVEKYAFGESIINIEASLAEGKWQLIKKDGTTPIINKPTMPLTNLQKRWMKAISLDPRIKLFGEEITDLEDVVPLFTEKDIVVFDKYADGDPYEDEAYIKNFRLILDAIRNRYPLRINITTRKGRDLHLVIMPEYLEYSEKDDKFRLIGSGHKYGDTVNLGRIVSCEPYNKEYIPSKNTRMNFKPKAVEFELTDDRNALERVLLHFAHFKKQAEKIDDRHYKISIIYDRDDETEILIRILSFGPMIKVTGPDSFVNLIKERLRDQKSCGH